jgi:hypothetical protein
MAQRDWNSETTKASKAETMGGIGEDLIRIEDQKQRKSVRQGCRQEQSMSRMVTGSDFREGQVVDRATGARGRIVQVARLAWVHAAAVDVVGGYYITHRHAAGLRYHVEHDGHHWAVTAAHLLWRV